FRRVDFSTLESIVKSDPKQRYHFLYESRPDSTRTWWIRANQGHSMSVRPYGYSASTRAYSIQDISSIKEISMAVWEIICMFAFFSLVFLNHVLSQTGPIPHVLKSHSFGAGSEVMIFIDVEHALEEDIKFYLSRKGVVLTPGNDMGYLEPRFFDRVE
ncbi:phosphotransferase KptA/Tpt1, partial [Mycena latifolia]